MAFAIIILERHSDPDVQLFADSDAAVAEARRIAHRFAWDPADVQEGLNDLLVAGGWLYYATWSGEGDSVYVVERDVR